MNTIHVETEGSTCRVRLARASRRNAFDAELIGELTHAFRTLPSGARVVVLSGEGAAFCAGADLGWMQRSQSLTEAENAIEARALADLFAAIDGAPQVVIGRVHGAAMGGGLGLVACCDLVIAAEGTRFCFSEVRLGLVPAVVSPYVVRKIGYSAARRYFVTGELFAAAEARRLGLVHEVVPEPELDERVAALVVDLEKNGPIAMQTAKKLVAALGPAPDPRAARDDTVAMIAALRVSKEGQEGLAAFLEKRQPRFLGTAEP